MCLASACCAVGSCLCDCLCWPAKALGVAQSNYSKLGYALMQVIWLRIGLIVVFVTPEDSDWACDSATEDCLGTAPSIYARISFSLAIFHLITLLIIIARTKLVGEYHDGCWGFKWCLVAAVFIASYWIPNDPFFDSIYMNIASVTSFGFLTFQALYMVLCSVLVNERIANNIQQDESTCSAIIGLVFLVLSTGANIAWIVMMFLNFGTSCTTNVVVLSITAAAYVLMHAVVFCGFRADASVFTSALVSLYVVFLQWSALSSNEDATCNPYADSDGNATARLVINMIVCFIAMFTAAAVIEDDTPAATIEPEGKGADQESKSVAINEKLLPAKDQEAGATGEQATSETAAVAAQPAATTQQTPLVFHVSKQSLIFQLLFVFSAIYFAMLLTNWGSPSPSGSSVAAGEPSKVAFWVQQAAQWVTILLYMASQTCFSPQTE